MTGLVVILAAVAVALVAAWIYDRRQRRRGVVVRAGAAMHNEAVHSRADLAAVPYEPVDQPGQHDWATYRSRDRRHIPEG